MTSDWVSQCGVGPGGVLQPGTVHAEVRIVVDPYGRAEPGATLTLKPAGSTLCVDLIMSAGNMRELSQLLERAAQRYEEPHAQAHQKKGLEQ